MGKKVKSFNVDGEVYSELVDMLKKNKVEGSLSLFVDNSLKILLAYLKEVNAFLLMRKKLKDSTYGVPLSYIINEIVNNPSLLETRKLEEMIDTLDESHGMNTEYVMEEWNDQYEAEQKKIPVEFYPFVKDGQYALAQNKKYIINKETGKKYISLGKDRLVPIDID